MKNKLIFIILVISFVLVICLASFGLKVGNFEIPSISKLITKNENINTNIETVTRLTSSDYPNSVTKLETTIDSLKIQKEKYEQISGFSEDDKQVYETEKYDIGYLWTTLGEYATKNNINLAMDVKRSTGTDLYNLYFTVQGEYVEISDFVTKIENDSNLSFRIYNFKLVPGSSNVKLKATFTVKDVNIDGDSLIKSTASVASNLNTSKSTTSDTDSTNTVQND